jgi:hypothetical protein
MFVRNPWVMSVGNDNGFPRGILHFEREGWDSVHFPLPESAIRENATLYRLDVLMSRMSRGE